MSNSVPPQKYVMLEQQTNNKLPPPYRRNVPRYHAQKSSGGGCMKCICCCYCFLVILIFLFARLCFYFYAVFQPEVPSNSLERIEVKTFNMQMDMSLNAEILVTVKAENPNKRIGFIYGNGSSIVVMYLDSELCSGVLPAFRQGYKNVTMIKVVLKRENEFGSGRQQALMDHEESGHIPLAINVLVPVRVVVGSVKTRPIKVLVNCSLVIDNLAPGKKVGILSTKYQVDHISEVPRRLLILMISWFFISIHPHASTRLADICSCCIAW